MLATYLTRYVIVDWTSRVYHSYIMYTIHCINKLWNISLTLLRLLHAEHTIVNPAEELQQSLTRLNFPEDKLVAVAIQITHKSLWMVLKVFRGNSLAAFLTHYNWELKSMQVLQASKALRHVRNLVSHFHCSSKSL